MGGTVYDRDTIMKKYMNGYDGKQHGQQCILHPARSSALLSHDQVVFNREWSSHASVQLESSLLPAGATAESMQRALLYALRPEQRSRLALSETDDMHNLNENTIGASG